MPTLYITEFASLGTNERDGLFAVPLVPSLADQTIAIGASSVQSAAFNAAARVVRVAADKTCSIKFGASPTATTSTMRLEAGAVEYFAVTPASGMKIAVIENT